MEASCVMMLTLSTAVPAAILTDSHAPLCMPLMASWIAWSASPSIAAVAGKRLRNEGSLKKGELSWASRSGTASKETAARPAGSAIPVAFYSASTTRNTPKKARIWRCMRVTAVRSGDVSVPGGGRGNGPALQELQRSVLKSQEFTQAHNTALAAALQRRERIL